MRALFALAVMMAPAIACAECSMPADTAQPASNALAPRAVALAWSPSESSALSVDAVLAREAFARCAQQRLATGAEYQKRTEFDNSPYRFNMKPGQKLNAAEFEAWMASRGIRIVRAKAEPAASAADTAPVVAD